MGAAAQVDRAEDRDVRVLITGAAGHIGEVARAPSCWRCEHETRAVSTSSQRRRLLGRVRHRRLRGPGGRRRGGVRASTPSSISPASPARRSCRDPAAGTWSARLRCWTPWSSTTYAGWSIASSNHAVGMTPRPESGAVGVDIPPRPDTLLRRRQGRRARPCSACTPTGTASPAWRCGSGASARRPRCAATSRPGSRTTTAPRWSRPR